MAGNPTNWHDLFDFSDNRDIRNAYKDLEKLTKAYEYFNAIAATGVMENLGKQQAELAGSIREIVTATKDLNIANREHQKAIQENTKKMQQAEAEHQKIITAQKGAKVVQDVLSFSVEGLTKQLKDQTAAYNKLDPTITGNEAKLKALGIQIVNTGKEIKILTDATKAATNQFAHAVGSYNALEAENKKLLNDLKNLEGGMDSTNGRARTMKLLIEENTLRLKAFDKEIAQNFRNVGNYASAFDGLNSKLAAGAKGTQGFAHQQFALTQILRETPNAALGMQTFILSLSNNLPILFDAIGDVNRQTGNWFKTLKVFGSSLFSVTSILTIGVTLLTLFSSKIFASDKATEKAKDTNNEFADSIKRVSQDIGKETTELEQLRRTAENANLPFEKRSKAIDTLQEKFPDYFAAIDREKILNGEVSETYDLLTRSIIENAKARGRQAQITKAATDLAELQAKLDILTKNNDPNTFVYASPDDVKNLQDAIKFKNKQLEQLTKQDSLNQQVGVNQAYWLDETQKKEYEAQQVREEMLAKMTKAERDEFLRKEKNADKQTKKDAKEAERRRKEAIKNQADLLKATESYLLENLELEYANSAKTLDVKIEVEKKKYDIIFQSVQDQKKLYKDGTDEYIRLQAKEVDAAADRDKNIQRIINDNAKTQRRRREQLDNELKQRREGQEDVAGAQTESGLQSQLDSIDLNFAGSNKDKGDIAKRERERFEAIEAYREMEVEAAKRALDGLNETDKDYFNKKKALINAEMALDKERSDYAIYLKEQEAEAKKEIDEALFNFGLDLAGQLFEIQADNTQAEIEKLKEQKDFDLEIAGDNAEAKKKIDKGYDAELKKLKSKQAQNEKLGALFDIGVATAVAVAKALPNIPLSITVGAIGLAQAAIVNAKDIPQYFKGRDRGPAEVARVNEKGFEFIERKGQLLVAGGGKDTITYLQKDDKVLTHEQSLSKIADNVQSHNEGEAFLNFLVQGQKVHAINNDAQISRAINAIATTGMLNEKLINDAFARAVGNIVIQQDHYDEKGYSTYMKNKNARVERLNKQNKFGK